MWMRYISSCIIVGEGCKVTVGHVLCHVPSFYIETVYFSILILLSQDIAVGQVKPKLYRQL